MPTSNALGIPHSGASPAAMQAYEAALRGFQQFTGDPVALLNAAIKDSPDFVMAHVARNYMSLAGTDPAPRKLALKGLPNVRKLDASPWEKAHVEACSRLAHGEMRACARMLEDIAIDNPLDILAVQVGHLLDLMVGDTRMLRDRPARALRYWSNDAPGYSSMVAMHAFGLEETGDYARAEQAGRLAIKLDPRDSWAQHAVAHVLEMQGRTEDGLAWMLEDAGRWSDDNFFAVHNWWHTSLYHLELGNYLEVLRLYDGPIYGAKSELVFDMLDASALLWRLHLRRVDASDRWQALADNWEKVADQTQFAFNDAHAMMAFAATGRDDAIARLRKAQDTAIEAGGDYNATLAKAGRAISDGMVAFGRGEYAQTVEHLRPVRNIAAVFGGSHAQRDIVDLTLIEAALRSGEMSLARALTAERAEMRPDLASTQMLVRRALTDAARTAA
jgi:tetratricopeptide (TPR) repeat protein